MFCLVAILLYLVAKHLPRVLPSRLTHMLHLSGKGTEPLGRRRPVLSPCVRQCRL
jgi:hypothetical protein